LRYTKEETELINRTARSWTKPPLVYRLISKTYRGQKLRILDYGAGPKALWTLWLRGQGFDVTAYDIAANQNHLHDSKALNKHYDVVVASNVVNVQPSRVLVRKVLKELMAGKTVYFNYPSEPHKSDMSIGEVELLAKRLFSEVKHVGTIFICKNSQ
jgi:2-polyprenyl-3-methyl-5-hydroxy-6-metoxy-1,4-benzoquinol methylase